MFRMSRVHAPTIIGSTMVLKIVWMAVWVTMKLPISNFDGSSSASASTSLIDVVVVALIIAKKTALAASSDSKVRRRIERCIFVFLFSVFFAG